jgi:hypothetical protein
MLRPRYGQLYVLYIVPTDIASSVPTTADHDARPRILTHQHVNIILSGGASVE